MVNNATFVSLGYVQIMKWQIYYSDGTTISDEDVTPFRIERRADIQVIMQESPDHNWVTLSGFDYYVWDTHGEETKWWGVDIFGQHHYFLQPGFKCILFGTMIDKNTFREIFNRAREEFGNKAVFGSDERHP